MKAQWLCLGFMGFLGAQSVSLTWGGGVFSLEQEDSSGDEAPVLNTQEIRDPEQVDRKAYQDLTIRIPDPNLDQNHPLADFSTEEQITPRLSYASTSASLSSFHSNAEEGVIVPHPSLFLKSGGFIEGLSNLVSSSPSSVGTYSVRSQDGKTPKEDVSCSCSSPDVSALEGSFSAVPTRQDIEKEAFGTSLDFDRMETKDKSLLEKQAEAPSYSEESWTSAKSSLSDKKSEDQFSVQDTYVLYAKRSVQEESSSSQQEALCARDGALLNSSDTFNKAWISIDTEQDHQRLQDMLPLLAEKNFWKNINSLAVRFNPGHLPGVWETFTSFLPTCCKLEILDLSAVPLVKEGRCLLSIKHYDRFFSQTQSFPSLHHIRFLEREMRAFQGFYPDALKFFGCSSGLGPRRTALLSLSPTLFPI